jgi:hypothetical protein
MVIGIVAQWRDTQMMQGREDRAYWLATMLRICDPVLKNLQAHTLRKTMLVAQKPGECRERYAHLEAFGRTLMGIAPWLECGGLSGPEETLRIEYAQLCRDALAAAVDPHSPDFLLFVSEETYDQPLVDAAFLSGAILRAPTELWIKLPASTKKNLTQCLVSARARTQMPENNHVLFAAIVEAALHKMGERVLWERVECALERHAAWYRGDGVYSDGIEYHCDYYNSFVIHPALLELYDTFMGSCIDSPYLTVEHERVVRIRAQRYARILEMIIAPDGSFPAVGRSIVYRMGVFHGLALAAWRGELPEQSRPAEVRNGLTVVIRRCMEAPGTFDGAGWLQIGLAGHQPHLGEGYISTGSLYSCMHVFLPLGLPSTDVFWCAEASGWYGAHVWAGDDMPADKAYREHRNPILTV